MSRPSQRLRREVVRRAANRCEYCALSQAGQEAEFHVDHVVPLAADGPTTLDNLALACVSCSLRKGARLEGFDTPTNALVGLFNPRAQIWREHFRWEGVRIVGLTDTGRVTIESLRMNRPLALEIRREQAALGRHPVITGAADTT